MSAEYFHYVDTEQGAKSSAAAAMEATKQSSSSVSPAMQQIRDKVKAPEIVKLVKCKQSGKSLAECQTLLGYGPSTHIQMGYMQCLLKGTPQNACDEELSNYLQQIQARSSQYKNQPTQPQQPEQPKKKMTQKQMMLYVILCISIIGLLYGLYCMYQQRSL